jgi:maltooligosyltrehalose trehalohydrolase
MHVYPELFTMKDAKFTRRMQIGAEPVPSGGVHFRVWAPRRRKVEVLTAGGAKTQRIELLAENDGYFSGLAATAKTGDRYQFRLDGEDLLLPDPASRFQPDGPHGASEIIDPRTFHWNDDHWPGVDIHGQVIYELHVGSFTPEGTFAAAARQLERLRDLGVTVIELMPVADFSGKFGWGYDGVNLFAPTQLYGRPDDLRAFVDRAHSLCLSVILDVVYNHFGPDGNYLSQFSTDYFTDRYTTNWGDPINFDGPGSSSVREYFLANVAYWIKEYHFDGFRFDATQNIYDESPDHILAAVVRAARAAAGVRRILIIGENEPQNVKLVQPPERGGYGFDALWNDDFHHSAMVAVTGRNEAYFSGYRGKPQELISAVKYGFLYQGQWYQWQRKRRGSSDFSLPPTAFVNFIQNHDQIANSGTGARCHQLTSPGRYRAITALTLLAPGTPMLFQGQEYGASQPFLYFADHNSELAQLVHAGRKKELSQFRSLATPEAQAELPNPADRQTFDQCVLDFTERERDAGIYQLHSDLLTLRKIDPAFSSQRRGVLDGAVIAEETFLLRFFGGSGVDDLNPEGDRLLIINLGVDLEYNPAPEPLLAAPIDQKWMVLWSSEDPRYGGTGTASLEPDERWLIPGHAAVVLRPTPRVANREEEKNNDQGED